MGAAATKEMETTKKSEFSSHEEANAESSWTATATETATSMETETATSMGTETATETATKEGEATTKKAQEEVNEDSSCEEERKKKLLYIFTIAHMTSYELHLSTLDPHEGNPTSMKLIDQTHLLRHNLPDGFAELRFHRITALEPKLYFIGGLHSENRTMTNKAFAFDTSLKAWETLPCMNLKRALSTVVTYANKIYVFGFDRCSRRDDETPPPPQHWAEFYDPKTQTWDFLPDTPPDVLTDGYSPTVHALIEEQKILLFCASQKDFYGYSFSEQRWFSLFSCCQVLTSVISWSHTPAVVNSSLFWHFGGWIYSYDLEPDIEASPISAIQHTLHSGRPVSPMCLLPECLLSVYFPSSFFPVYAGNGKLCLVHSCVDPEVKHGGYYIMFQAYQLQCSRWPKKSTLQYEGHTMHESHDRIYAVLAM